MNKNGRVALWRSFLTLSTLTIGGWVAAASGTAPLADDQFEELHAMVKPRKEEAPWTKIAWLTDLWEAREKAAAEGKPIFVWSASGEPQGCT